MLADLYNVPIGTVKKLVPNFFNKKKYVLYCENLKLYLRLELNLKQIHCILEFYQSQWLKPYVEFDTPKFDAFDASIFVEVAYHQTLTQNRFCLALLGFSVYAVFHILTNSSPMLLTIFSKKCLIVFSTCLNHFAILISNSS